MIQELIARLEKATTPDRELDAAIAVVAKQQGKVFSKDGSDFVNFARTYTASIDDAQTLVLSNAEWETGSVKLLGTYWANVITIDNQYKAKGRPTAAIALCIAALKARFALSDANSSAERQR